MQTIEARRNGVGGVDLVTESRGNMGATVLIMTGRHLASEDFWERLKETCNEVLHEMAKDEETDDNGQPEVSIDIDDIDEKVTLGEALTKEEQEFLINGILKTHFKDDDPKYDDSNRNWMESLEDKELLEKYYS
jgi:hypothetical protein